MRRKVLLAGLAFAAVAGFLAWNSVPAATPAPVAAAAPAGVGALGRVEPASRVRKLAQPGGFSVNRVDTLMVTEGDRVAV